MTAESRGRGKVDDGHNGEEEEEYSINQDQEERE
jgi:hypothetical protein